MLRVERTRNRVFTDMSNPNIEGNCYNCSRPLHRKTAHILFNANTEEYDAICKYCFLENPAYGRKIVVSKI